MKFRFLSLFILLGLFTTACKESPIPEPADRADQSASAEEILEESEAIRIVSEKDGMKLVYIPAGAFKMGSESGEDDEKPEHTVYLDAYWIDQTEVTNGMYALCVKAEKCPAIPSEYYGRLKFVNYPVVNVSWGEAKGYCAWVGRRLPTEAEWEKAARGTDERVYPWGSTLDESYANYGRKVGDPTAVGSYKNGASFYGAYDMAGNASEWVKDWYDAGYYSGSPEKDPIGPSTGEQRVIRGGSWTSLGDNLRVAKRDSMPPLSSSFNLGFRCAMDAQ